MRRLIPYAALFVLLGCAGGGAAPPAPLSELPTFLSLPDARIDVSEVASAPPPAIAFSAVKNAVGSGGEFSDEIALAPDKIGDANITFGFVLQDFFRQFTIPVNTNSNFETVIPPAFGASSGDVKIDFSDFDYDGNGSKEGCSGHTAALPICMRIWFGGEPFMEAVFSDFPTESSPGAGRFKAVVLGTGGDAGVRFAFNYNHSDPLNKNTESLLFVPPEDFAKTYRRSQISEVGPEGVAKKSINFSDESFFDSTTPSTIKYIGRFLQDPDPLQIFWSGSLDISPDLQTPTLTNVSDVCAQVATGNGVLEGTCQDIGIDTTGTSFIDFAKDADFAFFDFPLNPTF